jgi:hypothetical protein
MSKLHNADNLIRDKDRDFLGDDGHYWFSFLCPSESRADEHHRHVYQVRDDGEVAFCTCPYATNGGACTLVLCARDVARRAWAVDEPPTADRGGVRACRPCWRCPTRVYCAEHGCRYDFAASPPDPGGAVGEPPELATHRGAS